MQRGESLAEGTCGALRIEGKGGPRIEGGNEGAVVVVDHDAEKFSCESKHKITRGGGVFALEAIEEAGIHFEITGQGRFEAEGTFAVAGPRRRDEKSFRKAEGIGGGPIGEGENFAGVGRFNLSQKEAGIAEFEGVERRKRFWKIERRGEGKRAVQRTPRTSVAKGEGSLIEGDEGDDALAVGKEDGFCFAGAFA